jgi:hypothetical protein
MRFLALAVMVMILAACNGNADSAGRRKAIAIARRTVENSGMDMNAYLLRDSDVLSSEDGKWWRIVYRCTDKSSAQGCHAQVLLNIDTDEARLSASNVDKPEKVWPRASNGVPRDANVKCSDSSQCESLCLSPPNASAGEEVVGRCSVSYSSRCGDAEVRDGKSTGQAPCILY